ncbi:MAG: quinolinate synthase NadA [Syntrophomonas sp.]|uniref:quinolinate synthase NadA n=1 Tax=Syntrophomonas sp. TaxID=2053627 RepID=UPI002633CA16|nr:quinolinate synthase NadA [Syntrophomonas sp.]MDD4626699.1 quinolinate synthase NadA [Syntrophomonas sp.]
MPAELEQYVLRRKKEINAVILAHFYQLPEIQDIADFVGDSLQLAIQAAATSAQAIVFCGVNFMAESAKILNPDKTVILPDIRAGCPMADMAGAEALRKMKAENPGAAVVCYVNSSAEVKAESDICCTSSNALNVVRSIPEDRTIIFVPDQNLGAYIQSQTGRKMILWEGYCPIHHALSWAEVEKQKELHPEAQVVVHPECLPEVTRKADAVRSTAGILEHVRSSYETEFIIGTEEGFLYTLQKNCPEKKLYLARENFHCPDMKYITLEKLAGALENMEYQVEVPPEISRRAHRSLDRMIEIKG